MRTEKTNDIRLLEKNVRRTNLKFRYIWNFYGNHVNVRLFVEPGTFGQRRNVRRILFIVFGIFCRLQFNLTARSMPHFIHFVRFLLAISPLESLLTRFSSGFKIKTTLRHLRSDSVIHTTCINCFNEQKTLSFAKHTPPSPIQWKRFEAVRNKCERERCQNMRTDSRMCEKWRNRN